MMKIFIPLSLCIMPFLKFELLILLMSMSSMWLILLIMSPYNMNLSSLIFMSDYLSNIMVILSVTSTLLIILSMNNMNSKSLMMIILLNLILLFFSSKFMIMYILFEMILIPTMLLITKLGPQPERLKASIYLIIYTMMASLPLFVSILIISKWNNMIFPMITCINFKYPIFFMMAFLAKMPMFLLHLWLPKAHVEAPVEGSMILAAVLLKLGGYGLIRFFPFISMNLSHIPSWIISTSLWGALSTSMMCTRQKDLKALIAYSSVAHMGLVLSSLFTINHIATNGAIIMLIGHGISSSALFFLVNLIYLKFHTRNIISFKGIFSIYPNITFWWFLFIAVNISAPPSINLASELMMMMGLISWNLSSMLMLSFISIMTSTFSIMLFISISHNKSFLLISETSNSKNFISLFLHLFLIISLIMKMEFMFM